MTAAVETAARLRPARAFAPFEWMVAFRYLRARNAQKSISVIAGFSFLGIVLGVAALIVVMSVMNGFRHDLMEKMIGLNGHMFLQGIETPLTDYEAVTGRVAKVPGVTLALPLVEAGERALDDMARDPGQALEVVAADAANQRARGAIGRRREGLPLDQRRRQRHARNLGHPFGHRLVIGQRRLDPLKEHVAV